MGTCRRASALAVRFRAGLWVGLVLVQVLRPAACPHPDELLRFTRDRTTIFYASFFGLVNWVALGLQAFAASRILKYGGFGTLLLMLPVVAMFSYAALALVPILAVVKMAKVAENATDYSLNNTARR